MTHLTSEDNSPSPLWGGEKPSDAAASSLQGNHGSSQTPSFQRVAAISTLVGMGTVYLHGPDPLPWAPALVSVLLKS